MHVYVCVIFYDDQAYIEDCLVRQGYGKILLIGNGRKKKEESMRLFLMGMTDSYALYLRVSFS